jgi:hypothetical protein
VSTVYFETDTGDGLREPGFYNDRCLGRQITISLLTDAAGFPLTVAAFEGNTAKTVHRLRQTRSRLSRSLILTTGRRLLNASFAAATPSRVLGRRGRRRSGRWPVPIAVVAVVVGQISPRGPHREDRSEYSGSDICDVFNGVCELLAFGLRELSDDEHAVGVGRQNRGVGDCQQRGRIHDHIVEAPAQFAQDFLGCQRRE